MWLGGAGPVPESQTPCGPPALPRAQLTALPRPAAEFEHCWNTFVHHEGNRFQPWPGLAMESQKFSEKLQGILRVRFLPPSLPPPLPSSLLSPPWLLAAPLRASTGLPAPSREPAPPLSPLLPHSSAPSPPCVPSLPHLCGSQTPSLFPLPTGLMARPMQLHLLLLEQGA